jgi:hypothetical protein
MTILKTPLPHRLRQVPPFCADPNCVYCVELRKMFEQLRSKAFEQLRKQNESVKNENDEVTQLT